MSNFSTPCFETLPLEIFHRIFDNLDAQTICSSVRGTCRRFQAFVNSYDKFVWNFKQLAKPDVDLICSLIDPRNVISLTLNHEDKTLFVIKLFISRFDTEQFSRLRSLTLIEIEERHLKLILKCININSLISFALKIRQPDERCKNTTTTLLSSIIAQPNLRRLEFENPSYRIENPTWPVHSMIQHLRIGACRIFYPCMILRCLPALKTLIINFPTWVKHEIVFADDLTRSFQQLKSLTLEDLTTKIEILESLLSLVPSLTYFKLIGTGSLLDGNRWEQFIQANLPFLEKFEFFIQKSGYVNFTPADVESIIAPFRTTFWVEHKKLFATCEYSNNLPRLIQLYSIPICMPSLIYRSESKKCAISTFDVKTDGETSMMDNVKRVELNFGRIELNEIKKKIEEMRYPLFRKTERLKLEFNNIRLSNWTLFISTLIDLKRIVQIKFQSKSICEAESVMLDDVASLLEQTCNLSSLDIYFSYRYEPCLTAEDICVITPLHVRHLSVPIQSLNGIKSVLEQLEHLSSVKFSSQGKFSSREIVQWLKENRNGSSYRLNGATICIWLGKKHLEPKEVNFRTKRIKLIDDHETS